MAKRRLAADERRLRILEAATKTFAQMGYAEASMDQIAQASEVTKPVLYDHFKSKDALFVAVLESVRDTLLFEGEKASQSPLSRELQVHAAVEAFLTLAENSPDAMRVLLVVKDGHPVAAKAARAVHSAAAARIAAILKRTFPDAPDWVVSATAQIVLSGLHAIALWWLDNRPVSKDALVDLVAAILWGGISAVETGRHRTE